MRAAPCLIFAMLLSAAPASHERDLATQLPAEVVDYVVAARLDAGRAEELLKELFQRLRMRPRYALAVFPLPGDDRARAVLDEQTPEEIRAKVGVFSLGKTGVDTKSPPFKTW